MKFEDLRDGYRDLWTSLKFRDGWKSKAEAAAKAIIAKRAAYQAVTNATGVPWFVVGLVHQMESDRNFKTHLHNGDPLSARTTNVPFGCPRTGRPPFAWTESAVDALCSHKLDQVMSWPLERIAFELERYNGFRSRTEHNINTPYLWSGTQHYLKGKFIRDNVWSNTAVSRQVGAMAVLEALRRLDADIANALGAPPEVPEIPPPAPEPGDPPREAGRDLDLREMQRRLTTIPLYPPEQIDGEYGPVTQAAIQAFLVKSGVAEAQRWRGQQLVIAGAQALCTLDGIEAGPIDGLLGPQTRHALDVYAGRKSGDYTPEPWRDEAENREPETPPPPQSRSWPTEANVSTFYGGRGENQAKLKFPYPMRLAWATDQIVNSTSCHKKIQPAATRVLNRVLEHYGIERIRELRLDYYGGCLNIRRKREGASWSMHSWGIAFDFDPDRNKLKWNHTRAVFARPEYKKWFELWEEEGALSLGRARDFDWMHIQFARL